MKPKVTTYLLLIGHVATGLVLLVLIQQLKLPADIKTGIIFTVLLLLNLLYARIFDLKETLNEYWSLQKLPYMFAGFCAGLALVAIPIIAALITGRISIDKVQIGSFSIASVFLTFLIIGWEELWFRSLLLNYCSRHLSKFNIALTMGLLFMLIHLLNPEIRLIKEGLVLFLAGALLTSFYFYYRTIWLPAGLHFGNNFFGSIIHSNITSHPVFGSEGYIYTALLLVATIYFLLKLRTDRVGD